MSKSLNRILKKGTSIPSFYHIQDVLPDLEAHLPSYHHPTDERTHILKRELYEQNQLNIQNSDFMQEIFRPQLHKKIVFEILKDDNQDQNTGDSKEESFLFEEQDEVIMEDSVLKNETADDESSTSPIQTQSHSLTHDWSDTVLLEGDSSHFSTESALESHFPSDTHMTNEMNNSEEIRQITEFYEEQIRQKEQEINTLKERQAEVLAYIAQKIEPIHEEWVLKFLNTVAEHFIQYNIETYGEFLKNRLEKIILTFQNTHPIEIHLPDELYKKHGAFLQHTWPHLKIVEDTDLKNTECLIKDNIKQEFLFNLEKEIETMMIHLKEQS